MKVVVTRAAERSVQLAASLRAAGHEAQFVPLTAIEPAAPFPDPKGFDGVLFTSASAVARASTDSAWPRVGAVGLATAAALRQRGIRVDVVGSGGGAELAAAWGSAAGQRLLLPQAEEAHPALAAALRAADAEVVTVGVYRSVCIPDVDIAPFREADVICFFAPSHVAAFRALRVRTEARFWGVGPTTRAAMDGMPPLQGHLDGLENVP
ncbi:MAG: uroporphyrinogen-III synthase [Planctomycetota bacterium]|nr:uroporphyrinogen-III synthase [Planctomycetota bacterium]